MIKNHVHGISKSFGGGIVKGNGFFFGDILANVSGSSFIVTDVTIPSIPKHPEADFN